MEITAQGIVQEIIDREGLDSKNRNREVVYRRQYLMWFLRRVTNLSFMHIGMMFDRDHATVMHACRSVDHSMKLNDMYFLKYVADLKNNLDEFDFEKPKYKGNGQRVLTLLLSKDDYKSVLKMSEDKDVSEFVMSCVRGWNSINN